MSVFDSPIQNLKRTVTEIENEISRVYAIPNQLPFHSRAWSRFESGRDADLKELEERKFKYQIAINNLINC